MGPVTVQLDSPEATHALGARLGALLQPGDFVGLVGELGAGKTQLVRGVASGAGVAAGEVASPTFAIVYPYQGRVLLYHADLYRLESEDELYGTGFSDLVTAGDGAVLVEWVEKVPGATPRDWLRVELRHAGGDARELTATALGPRAEALRRAWLGA